MDKDIDLNTSGVLPASDDGITGGTNGALRGAGLTDLRRGYSKLTPPDEPYYSPFGEKEGGFAGRPCGFER